MSRKSCLSFGVLVIFMGLSVNAFAAGANFNGDNGRYKVISRLSGKAMDVAGKSTANGANIIAWSYGGGLNQQWDIADVGGGYYSIRAAHSGKSINVDSSCLEKGCDVIHRLR